MNICIVSGNLGADPEEFFSHDGTPVVKFTLAFKSSRDKTGWIKTVCFNRLAETATKYLHKGARICIAGTLDQNKWENDEGQTRSNFQLIAHNIDFIKTDGRGFEGKTDEENGPPF